MKSIFVRNVALLAGMAGLLSACSRHDADDAEAQKTPPVQTEVVTLDAAAQERLGLELQQPASAEIQPRFAVTGRVIDVTTLAAEATDLVSAEAAAQASQADRKRLETLAAQNNASERALQAAEAAAARDQAQADAARSYFATLGVPLENIEATVLQGTEVRNRRLELVITGAAIGY